MPNRVRLCGRGAVALGALTWVFRGQARVTAVVKAAFDPAGRPCPPERLRAAGAAWDGGWGSDGLLRARDRVPYRPGVDLFLDGRAVAPGAPPPNGGAVSLSILRGEALVLHKRLTRLGPPGPSGFGALSPEMRARACRLRSHELERLLSEPLDLPDDFDWRYFHAAPQDQRLSALYGDERIVVEGLAFDSAQHFALPEVHPVAAAAGASHAPGMLPIELVADTLEIDTDHGSYALVWRGSVALEGDEQAHAIHAWLEQPRGEAARAQLDEGHDDSTRVTASRASAWARDADEVTRVAVARGLGLRSRDAPRPAALAPFRPDAAPPQDVAEARDAGDDERAPDSSGTRPMLPIDHLLAIGRRAVPYDEGSGAGPPKAEAGSTRRPVTDAGAWIAERSPRGVAAAGGNLAIRKGGLSLDDAPEAQGPLPPIVMASPEPRSARAEPYDDEVTALRPCTRLASLPGGEQPARAELDASEDDSSKR